MGRLTSIPVLGRLLRIFSAFVRAPERFDALFAGEEELQRSLDARAAEEETLRYSLDARVAEENKIWSHIFAHSRMLEKQEIVQQRSERRLSEHDRHILHMLNLEPEYVSRIVARIATNPDHMIELNRNLSINPTIWGDPGKLNIAKTASVYTCLFNTNSGTITVGDYTFAGSRVNLLAGSHEIQLRGFLRRDVEFAKNCDIVIGNGVWLASGCTLLGPCTVGDNAVIAAGAVVAPGTNVPANAIYGGVPARQIGALDFSEPQDENNAYVRQAFEKSGGLLLVDGWSERKAVPEVPEIGYWLVAKVGRLLSDRREWTLHYALEGADSGELILEGSRGTARVALMKGPGKVAVRLPIQGGAMEPVTLRLGIEGVRLFMAWKDEEGNETGGQDE